ncbi:MAG: metallophosphoesterase family protein [Dehalococcoidia bacterium]|nr:metallophosphoesterase family protein [Dehalococcoidia bacterium]
MRIAIVSDVHANLAALEAVLRHAADGGPVDAIWCLGDTVGYGPQPSQCVARLREARATLVAGNHDRAATGKMGTEEFNPDAATAALWTRDHLEEDATAYLDSLPEVTHDPQREFTLVHGTLRWPLWEYLYSYEAARAHLERQETPFSLVGHTHVPMLVAEGEKFEHGCEMYYLEDGQSVPLPDDRKIVLNPGSVGQPRDGDPRAAYALYDTDARTVTVHRVEYDIGATQALMETAGLPRRLIDRLSVGR